MAATSPPQQHTMPVRPPLEPSVSFSAPGGAGRIGSKGVPMASYANPGVRSRLQALLRAGPRVHSGQLTTIRTIGKGGFGEVDLCWYAPGPGQPRRKVAVKHFYLDKVPTLGSLRLIARELEALKQAQGIDSVVELVGVGCDNEEAMDSLFVVLEYLPGGSLKKLMTDKMADWNARGTTTADAVAWGVQIAAVLSHLHQKNPQVIHRDVKLDNMLLSDKKVNTAGGVQTYGVKLIDYGLARTLPLVALPDGPEDDPKSSPIGASLPHDISTSSSNLVAPVPPSLAKLVNSGSAPVPTPMRPPMEVDAVRGRRDDAHDCDSPLALHRSDTMSSGGGDDRPTASSIGDGAATVAALAPPSAAAIAQAASIDALGLDLNAVMLAMGLDGARAAGACASTSALPLDGDALRAAGSAGRAAPPAPAMLDEEALRSAVAAVRSGGASSSGAVLDAGAMRAAVAAARSGSAPKSAAALNTSATQAATAAERGGSAPKSAVLLEAGARWADAAADRCGCESGVGLESGAGGESGGGGGESDTDAYSKQQQLKASPKKDARKSPEKDAAATGLMHDLTRETGSLMYMAPEVYLGKPYNHKADVFSFAVCMYELLHRKLQLMVLVKQNAGRTRAQKQAAVEEYARKVAHGYRPPISMDVPLSLATLLESCWDEDPQNRPSMPQVHERLTRILAEEDLSVLDKHPNGCGSCCITS